jgi:hypothetical protein
MTAPSYLSGSMPGDFGFDPLGLGAQGEDRLKWCAPMAHEWPPLRSYFAIANTNL